VNFRFSSLDFHNKWHFYGSLLFSGANCGESEGLEGGGSLGPRQSGKTTLAREFSRADACGEDEELCGAVANLEFLRLAHSSIAIFSRG